MNPVFLENAAKRRELLRDWGTLFDPGKTPDFLSQKLD